MLKKTRKKTALPAVCAVIVAAGSSRRMGGENKLLLPLGGVPVLAHTLSAFEKCAAVRDIVLVCREQDIVPYTELARAYGISKLRTVTRGGDSRTASVLAGIGAAAPVVPVKDSIKRIENGCIAADVPRDTLAAVQTPQVFRRETLLHTLQQAAWAGRTFTDDCAAVEACGQTVRATHGSYENIKITTPEDIASAEAFLQQEAD